MSQSPWIRISKPYAGGELVLMAHKHTGKQSVLLSKEGETSYPLWNKTISDLVATMRLELAQSLT
jgi:hypothetical protein